MIDARTSGKKCCRNERTRKHFFTLFSAAHLFIHYMRSAARRLFRRQAITTTINTTTITTTTSSTHHRGYLLSSLFVRHFMTETKENSKFVSPSKILVSYDPSTANEHLSLLLREKDITRSVESKHSFAVIGFDTETRPTFSKVAKKNKVALVQFASKNVACLIHLASMNGEVPEMMTKILREKEYVLLGFGIKTDLKELKTEHYGNDDKESVDVNAFIDLATISEVFKHERPGMKGMANHFGLDVEKPKAVQISNWENSPLREGQVKYAAEDASLGVWLAERMYNKYGRRKDTKKKNSHSEIKEEEYEYEHEEEDDRYDGFLQWMHSFRNAENTKKLNKRQLPKDAAALVLNAELQTVNKYATLRFQDAKKLLKQYHDGKKHPTATLFEFFNSLSKTLPNEYTKDGRGFEFVRFNESVSKAKKEDSQPQNVSVFSCEYDWTDIGETVRGCSGSGKSSSKKGAKAEACKDALAKCEEWLKSFENQWFFELALKEKQSRVLGAQ
jgi:ribonuclease D